MRKLEKKKGAKKFKLENRKASRNSRQSLETANKRSEIPNHLIKEAQHTFN